MKRIWFIVLVLLTACARTKPDVIRDTHASTAHQAKNATSPATALPAAQEWKVSLVGKPYQLNFRPGALAFCDDRGGQQVDLATGKQSAVHQACVMREDEVTGCSDDALGIAITSPDPPTEPNDKIEIGSNDYWLKGRADGCANDGRILIVGTGFQVVVIDGIDNKLAVIDRNGADQVAIGSGWVAWKSWDGKKLSLMSQSAAFAHAIKQ